MMKGSCSRYSSPLNFRLMHHSGVVSDKFHYKYPAGAILLIAPVLSTSVGEHQIRPYGRICAAISGILVMR